jgi:PAS domain S-box-containing protein
MTATPRTDGLRSFQQWGILIASLLALGGFLGWVQFQDYRRIDIEQRERLAAQAETVEKNVVPQILLANRVIERIVGDLPAWQAEHDGFKRANRELRVINDTLLGIRPILIIRADGIVTASSNETLIGQNFAHREYFKTALANPDPAILHVAAPFKTVLDTFVISLFRSIRGPQGEFAGIVIVSVVPEYFSSLLDSVRYASDMRTGIIHGGGQVFLTSPADPSLAGKDVSNPASLVSRHLASGLSASVLSGRTAATGEERLVAHRTLQTSTPPMDKALVIVAGRDLQSIFVVWRRDAALQGGLFGIVALVTSLSLVLFQRRQLALYRLMADRKLERRQAGMVLRESEERWKFAIEGAGDGLWDWNIQTGEAYYSPRYKEMFGYADADIGTTSDEWSKRIHPDDAPGVFGAIQPYMDGKPGSATIEFRMLCKDGSWKWTLGRGMVVSRDTDGKPLRMIGTNTDITERKRVEMALRISEERYKLLVEESPLGIIITQAGLSKYVNPALLDMIGYPDSEILERSFFPFIHEGDQPWVRELHLRRMKGEPVDANYVVRMVRKDGQVRHWQMKTNNIEWNGMPAALGIVSDISDRIRMETDLREARDAAETASLTKSRFLAAASHDLRQPMQAISLFTEALVRTDLNAEQKRISDYLAESTQSLGDLLNTLLDISRLDAGVVKAHPDAIAAETLVSKIDAEFSPMAAAKGLRFKLSFPLKEMALMTDGRLFMSLLGNLIGNAIKYTTRGGILVAIRRRGDQALIQVWDTGIGIDREHLDSIYEEYFQIGNPERDRKKGLGLGLAVVRRVAKLLETEVVCRSRPGRGSVFEFLLPLADPAAKDMPDRIEAADVAPDAVARLTGRHIVVVEDDVMVATAIQLSLESLGASVVRYGNAEAALMDAAITGADFFVTDFQLPGLNGVEFLDAVQKRSTKPIKALLLTGDMTSRRIGTTQSSPWPLLCKPVDLSSLLSAIRSQDSAH